MIVHKVSREGKCILIDGEEYGHEIRVVLHADMKDTGLKMPLINGKSIREDAVLIGFNQIQQYKKIAENKSNVNDTIMESISPFIKGLDCPECGGKIENGVCQSAACKARLL